jgi:hypothetical protein
LAAREARGHALAEALFATINFYEFIY